MMMLARPWLRAGLVFLAVTQFVTSMWQLLFPRSFYDDVPTVAMEPPFSEHLMRDLGAMGLALTVVLASAAIIMERHLVSMALAAYLTWAVPHLVFHSTHVAGLSMAWAIALITALALAVAIPIALLILAFARPTASPLSGRRGL